MMHKLRQKTKPFRKSYFITMVLSIAALICIPLISFQLWLVQQSTSEMRENNTHYYVSALQNNAYSYQRQIDMLDYNALKISSDKMISKPLDPKANGYNLFQAAQVVKGYSIGLPSVEEIGFYYPSRDAVLMDGYQPSKELFFRNVGALEESTQQELMEFLKNIQSLDVFLVRNSDSYGKFLVARPVYLQSKTDFDGVVIYVLDPDELALTFQVNIPADSNVAIVSPEGEWLMFNSDFPIGACQSEAFADFLTDSGRDLMTLSVGDMNMEVYKYSHNTDGNIFLSTVMQKDSQRQLTAYVERVTAFVVLSMLLMIVLLAVTVYINYRPVKKLVMRHTSTLGSNARLSELELLDSVFFAQDAKISNQRSLLGNFILGDLIYGTDVEDELLERQFDLRRLHYFAVATVSAVELTASQANAVAEELSANLENTEVHTTSMPNRPHILFILLSQDPINIAIAKANVHIALRTVADCDGDVRVGEVVQSLEDLRKSYYSSFVEQTAEAEPDDMSAVGEYPAKEVQSFIKQVCVGDKEGARKSLEKIELLLATRKLRPVYRQYCCYKLLSTFLTTMQENKIEIKDEETDALMAFRSPTRLFELLRETADKCCDFVTATVATSNMRMRKELVSYVDENLTDCGLCLLSAADHMNVSIYAVSRLFKEATGVGFKEYVIQKRLEMAYKLLKDTRTSVTEVARAVGIENTKYFSEMFKKYYGKSATQIRSK